MLPVLPYIKQFPKETIAFYLQIISKIDNGFTNKT